MFIRKNALRYIRAILGLAILFAVAGSFWFPRQAEAQGQWTTSGSDLYNSNSGNVGIGTTTPAYPLDVNGKARATSFTFNNPNQSVWSSDVNTMDFSAFSAFRFNFGQGPISYGTAMSIGTTSGILRLGYDGITSNMTRVIKTSRGANFTGGDSLTITTGIGQNSNPAGSILIGPGIEGTDGYSPNFAGSPLTLQGGISSGNSDGGPIIFKVTPAGTSGASGNTLVTAMTISGGGNVGIGTSSPTAKLTVVGDTSVTGNITATGSINAKYQDVAEWVPSTQKLSGGTVVILDSSKRNNVIASAKSYDTKVAGVVSERPGVLLGEGGAGKAIIATTGRVMVKVDATRKAVEVGDLLVTSDLSGYAMRSDPVNLGGIELHRPGTLIGKALEPLAKGKKGEILALLSLQ